MCIQNLQKIVYRPCHLFMGAEKLGENGISGSSNIVQVKNAAGTLHLKVHNLQSNIC